MKSRIGEKLNQHQLKILIWPGCRPGISQIHAKITLEGLWLNMPLREVIQETFKRTKSLPVGLLTVPAILPNCIADW
jgi:hypothetical protein